MNNATRKKNGKERVLHLTTLVLLVTLLTLPTTTAFKVSPAGKSMTLDPGSTTTYDLRVTNDDGGTRVVNITVSGPLAPHILVTPTTFTMKPGTTTVTVTITHPSTTEYEPGPVKASVNVRSMPTSTTGQFSGGVILAHPITLYNPYAGAYLAARFTATSKERPSPHEFTLSITNYGDRPTSANGEVTVFEGNVSKARVDLGSTTFNPGVAGKLAANWKASTRPGVYNAVATLSYDDLVSGGKEETYTATFTVDKPSVTLEPRVPATLTAGRIERVPVTITLDWNEAREASLTTRLSTLDGDELFTSESPVQHLPARGSTTIDSYVELDGVNPGNYTLSYSMTSTQGETLGAYETRISVAKAPLFARARGWQGVTLLSTITILLLTLVIRVYRRRRRKNGARNDARVNNKAE